MVHNNNNKEGKKRRSNTFRSDDTPCQTADRLLTERHTARYLEFNVSHNENLDAAIGNVFDLLELDAGEYIDLSSIIH